jgi:Putative zinc-finger
MREPTCRREGSGLSDREPSVSCTRSQEIDLLSFFEEPRRPELRAFCDHYPRCRECSAEVAAWDELIRRLGDHAQAPSHPEPEVLARYDAQSAGLDPAERVRIERHLAGCAPCRDELRALRGFDPAAARAGAGRRERPEPGRRDGATWLATVGRVIWHPAFAYAVATLLLLPVLYRGTGFSERPARSVPTSTPEPRLELPAAAAARDKAVERPAPGGLADAFSREQEGAVGTLPKMAESRALSQRADAERGSIAKEEPSAPDQESGGTVELLTSRRAPRVSAALPLRLRVPVPPGADAEVELRLIAPGGRRELRERRPVAPRAEWIELDVPAGWLVPGRNAVEVRAVGGGRTGQPISYALVVE